MKDNILENEVKNKIYGIILAFVGTYGMQGIMASAMSEDIRFSNSIFSFFVFIALSVFNCRIIALYCEESRKHKICIVILGGLLSIALHFGARMEVVDNVRMTDISLWIRIVCFVIGFLPVLSYCFSKIDILMQGIYANEDNNKKLNYYQIWGIIFLMWLPVFFALYPGAFVYDAQDEYVEVISRAFTMHHPLIHVLLLGGIIHAAEYVGLSANFGIAVYVIIQMLIMSAILAYGVKALEKWGLKKKYLIVSMVFYGLFPIFPMYGVCTAKDSLFTAFLYLVFLLSIEFFVYIKDENETSLKAFFEMKRMLLYVFASVIMMLLRNNGVYAYAFTIPFILIVARISIKTKDIFKYVRKLIILMFLSVLIYVGCNYILKTVTNASDNEHQEMFTVGIQQLARTYTYSKEVFSDEDINTLYEILPEEYLITYTPRVSDVLKSGFDNAKYESNPGKYKKLWLNIGLKKPLIYINAWLGTSYGYWYPDAINNVYEGNQMYTYQYNQSSYFGFETEPPGFRDSKFRVLEIFYEKLSLELFQQKLPVISMLFSPGFVFWIFAFVFMSCIYGGEGKSIIILPLVMIFLLWLTVLLGPTTLVRYVLILWFILPVYPVFWIKNR